jgi:cytoskeletal protein RodZ
VVKTAPSKNRKKAKALLIGLPLFLVLLGVSALIGMTDKGELDVARAITERKQNATSDEEKQALESVPTEQIAPSAPNGGLVGMGAPEPVPVVPEVTASSTADSASSTPETTSEEGVTTGTQETEPESNEPQASEDASTVTAA